MKWEVRVPVRGGAGQLVTATVEAENWKSALAAALRQLDEPYDGLRSYCCDVRGDGSLRIVDFGSGRAFLLRNLEYVAPQPITPPPEAVARRGAIPPPASSGAVGAPAVPAAPELSPAPSPSVGPAAVPGSAPATPSLPAHHLFFWRNEEPSSGSSLWYRERLIAVPPGTTREGINMLLMHYYNALRAEAADLSEAKYVNVAVFDHAFTARAERPALGVLTWKSWRSEVPEVSYPADEPPQPLPQVAPPAAAPVGKQPPVPSAAAPSGQPPPPAVAAAPAAPVASSTEASSPGTVRSPVAQTGRRRLPTPADLARIGRDGQEEMVINEILAQVFEEMTGLFSCRTREAAAEFALDVAMRRVPCEAGSVLFSDINSRDLVFTAVRGEVGHRLKGRRVLMGKGIVGVAAREGVAIAIPDVRKDGRWSEELDREVGFTTRSVIVAPMVHEGRTYGALELLNRKGADVFLQTETSIVSYIASELAAHLATVVPSGGEPTSDEVRPTRVPAPRPGAYKMTSKRSSTVPKTGQGSTPPRGGKKR